jgi:hypothetical protein
MSLWNVSCAVFQDIQLESLLQLPSVKYKRLLLGYFFTMKKTCPSSCLSEMSLALSSGTSSLKVIDDILSLNLRDCCWLYLYLTRLTAGGYCQKGISIFFVQWFCARFWERLFGFRVRGGLRARLRARQRHNGPKLIKCPYCKLTNHNWEHCNTVQYVLKGVLYRRSCLECDVKFQYPTPPGVAKWIHPQLQTWDMSNANSVEFCTHCKVALCPPCYPKFLEKQRVEQGNGSPRKAKKGISYGKWDLQFNSNVRVGCILVYACVFRGPKLL